MGYRFALIVVVLFAAPAAAQIEDTLATPQATKEPAAAEAAAQAEPSPEVDPELKLRLASPRACLESFTSAVEQANWSDAVDCMDFSSFAGDEAKITVAYQLHQILNGVRVDSLVPDAADFEGPCTLSEYAMDAETSAPLEGSQKADFDRIEISQNEDGLWRFDSATVRQIATIYENWKPTLEEKPELARGPKPTSVLLKELPVFRAAQTKRFLLPDYMWISLVVVMLLGFLADALVGFLALRLSRSWLGMKRSTEQDNAVRRLWKPVGLLLQALVWYYGTTLIGLPIWVTDYLPYGLRFFAVFAGAWVLFRLIDIASGYLAKRAEKTATRFDDLLIPLVSKSLKVVAILLGVLICAQTFEWQIKSLLGGLLGLGGMALALASRDAVSNLFGSLTVLMDRPFEIGDWVIAENIEGTVEQVGFRSTRIRTFYNSLITLPNSRLTTTVVDNMGRRRYRRVKTTIGVQYTTTPEQLDAFCEGIRELIRRAPATRKDYFHVYFNGFGESSLDILVYLFVRVPDWSTELREKHQLFNAILRLAQELKVEFAFPTRTLHMHPETAPPSPYHMPQADAELFGRESASRIADQMRSPRRRKVS